MVKKSLDSYWNVIDKNLKGDKVLLVYLGFTENKKIYTGTMSSHQESLVK